MAAFLVCYPSIEQYTFKDDMSDRAITFTFISADGNVLVAENSQLCVNSYQLQ